MNSTNKTIRVAAAIIVDNDKYFVTQRGYGEWKGFWEFPGGKIEQHETPQEALQREIREELETEIAVGDKICTVEYDYPAFHLSMDCFYAKIASGNLILKEHSDSKWLNLNELDKLEWVSADKIIIEKLKHE